MKETSKDVCNKRTVHSMALAIVNQVPPLHTTAWRRERRDEPSMLNIRFGCHEHRKAANLPGQKLPRLLGGSDGSYGNGYQTWR